MNQSVTRLFIEQPLASLGSANYVQVRIKLIPDISIDLTRIVGPEIFQPISFPDSLQNKGNVFFNKIEIILGPALTSTQCLLGKSMIPCTLFGFYTSARRITDFISAGEICKSGKWPWQ